MLLHEKLQSYRLILASHSPRRQQLLRDAGLSYLLADKYEVEENYPATLPAADVPRFCPSSSPRVTPSNSKAMIY